MEALALLAQMPTTTVSPEIEAWAARAADELRATTIDAISRHSFTYLDAASLCRDNLLKFSNAALLADWTVYEASADRVEAPRLRQSIGIFPAGFRVWFCELDGVYMPVGYTGWYPIDEEIFLKAAHAPHTLMHRRELWPMAGLRIERAFVWLFNYSIIAPLRRSEQSRTLLGSYPAALAQVQPRGMAAAVISEESKRVARRFGMSHRGYMTHDGVPEAVYAMVTNDGSRV